MSGLGIGLFGGVIVGLLFTILVAIIDSSRKLGEIRDRLKERKND